MQLIIETINSKNLKSLPEPSQSITLIHKSQNILDSLLFGELLNNMKIIPTLMAQLIH
jgi:hypothetical protein